jgi:hypothetical protein
MKIFNRKKISKLENKDPADFTLTKSSTNWITDSHYCSNCKHSTSHREFMSGVCNSCGEFNTQVLYGRSYRKIYIDDKWKYQFKYHNGSIEIKDKFYE